MVLFPGRVHGEIVVEEADRCSRGDKADGISRREGWSSVRAGGFLGGDAVGKPKVSVLYISGQRVGASGSGWKFCVEDVSRRSAEEDGRAAQRRGTLW